MNSSTNPFRLTVYGTPQPAGSKKAFVIKSKAAKSGHRAVVVDDAKKSRPWKDSVSREAVDEMRGAPLIKGPLSASFHFTVRRPKAHFDSRGELRSTAPAFPTTRPDVLKLARAVEDALTGIVYEDDSQIVRECLYKDYVSWDCQRECVTIIIEVQRASDP